MGVPFAMPRQCFAFNGGKSLAGEVAYRMHSLADMVGKRKWQFTDL
ncbi:MAG: hypothetical protein MJE68_03235 [Proteobacteria bacterium]|nr:hypothetical protein [Pseudomonadota bacterium]